MIPDITGALSGIANIVPLPGRMIIIALDKVSPVPIPSVVPPFVAQFNPELYSENLKYKYYCEQAPNSKDHEYKINTIEAEKFSFEFLLDGTGASGEKREVKTDIEIFKRTIAYSGEKHRPRYLLLIWGTFIVTAVMTSLDIKYSMFRDNGTPLRATLSVNFRKHTPKTLELLSKAMQSPDLTTNRLIDASDNLPLMCHKVYDESRHYIEVARANGLTNFRSLRAGRTLDFPPVAKTE